MKKKDFDLGKFNDDLFENSGIKRKERIIRNCKSCNYGNRDYRDTPCRKCSVLPRKDLWEPKE